MLSGLAANPCHEEPDALIAHVRIRGGPGWVTSLAYPASARAGVTLGPRLGAADGQGDCHAAHLSGDEG